MEIWHKCYESGWKSIIVPEAFSHPAKMAYGLLRRILAHAKEQGWLKEGDVIIDPFGGIGSTGILGAYEGYQVVCCELERNFIQLAEGYDCPGLTKKEWLRWLNRFGRNPDICPSCHGHAQAWYEKHSGIIPFQEPHHFVGNFELHKDAWVEFGNPFPVIIQGDSRRLCEIVEKADCIVSSPPWTQQEGSMQSKKFKDPKESAKMLSDRNAEGVTKGHYATPAARKRAMDKANQQYYGNSPGQLGAMKPGKVDMVISSPPYADISQGGGKDNHPERLEGGKKGDLQKDYGKSKGHLGNLKPGNVDCVISSPPWEGTGAENDGRKEIVQKQFNESGHPDSRPNQTGGYRKQSYADDYGSTPAQLGTQIGDTFWQAAKIIIEQCHQILKPGGHAIWVVKSFVRKKKIVDFPGDWQKLCESVGFKTVCIHHAMLVKETEHQTLFGDTEVKRKERKSFFRRLAESKGSPRIDYEVVLCMRKSVHRNRDKQILLRTD